MDPKDHFKKVCTTFYDTIEKDIKQEEERFEKTIDQYRSEIKALHTRMKDAYKNILQFMLNNVYDEDKKELFEAIEIVMENVTYAEEFATVIKEAHRLIQERKRPMVIHDKAQYVYGTKPLYFGFDEEEEEDSSCTP